jgi:VCBS repeat-containing protein
MTAITPGSTSATGGTVVVGTYGTLTIGANGSYSYALDNTNPLVNALKNTETLTDVFSYTLKDPDSLSDIAQISITINGHTDGGALAISPVDGNATATGQASVYESGLTSNGPALQPKTTTGSILVDAPEGIASVTVGGTTLTVAQLTALSVASPSAIIDTGEGELRITGITVTTGSAAAPTAAQVSYIYTLKATIANTLPADTESTDTIALLVTDKSAGAATASGNLLIQIVDDTPTANADTNSVTEGTTTANTTITGDVYPASTSSGNVADRIGADSTSVNPVTHVIKGSATPNTAVNSGTTSADGTIVAGDYGSLKLGADGSYSYDLDNTKAAVNALNTTSTPLTEVFTYRITDADGDVSDTTLTITINGSNDGPIAVDDTHAVVEDSGTPSIGNAITGIGSPNTIADSDPDNVIGDLSLSGIRTGTEVAGGTMTAITPGSTSATGGTVVVGTYGTLTIGANGSYSYALDNANPTVNALIAGESLTEVFTYTLSDGALTDIAQLTITINGATDGAPTVTPVDGNAAATGQSEVYESGLTLDGPGGQSKTGTGTLTLAAPDGLSSVSVGGTSFTVAELTAFSVGTPSAIIDTGEGELRLTGLANVVGTAAKPTTADLTYTYTLKASQNQVGAAESTDTIALVITDARSTPATATARSPYASLMTPPPPTQTPTA